MTKNDFDPIKNGLVLWEAMPLAAVLYGTEVIHFKRQDIKELESIQANFFVHLLGQRTSVSHTAIREEVRATPIEQILMTKKLKYWYHLTKSTEGSWLRAAFVENFQNTQESHMKRQWKSSFEKEILDIQKDVGILHPKLANSRAILCQEKS